MMPLDDHDGSAPGFFVFDIPILLAPPSFAGQTIRPAKRILLPVLAVMTADGAVDVPDEALSWGRHLAQREVTSLQIRRRLNSVGRLFEFAETVVGAEISRPGVMDLVVWEYLRARVENPVDPGERQFEHWCPVQYELVRTEFRDLVDFGQFCAAYTGPTSPIGSALKAGSEIWIKANRSLPAEDFLSHLAAQRARWHALLGDEGPMPPIGLKRLSRTMGRKKSDSNTALSKEEIDCIIDRERNPMFRALWIELAYLGPRVSEPLNQWRCDVLDSSYAPSLFVSDVDGPLVIFADPRDSRYTGSLDGKASIKTRKQVLRERYGLSPRPDEGGRNQRVGWKGMSTFNPQLLITHGTWICHRRAEEYGRLVREILDMHAFLGTEAMHPYLYINVKNAEYLGEPLKRGNVEEAFDRACVRAGVTPHSPGANLHGCRHFYRWYAKHELGLSDEIVQRMLRQRSQMSQRVYGKRASDAHEAMSKLRGRG